MGPQSRRRLRSAGTLMRPPGGFGRRIGGDRLDARASMSGHLHLKALCRHRPAGAQSQKVLRLFRCPENKTCTNHKASVRNFPARAALHNHGVGKSRALFAQRLLLGRQASSARTWLLGSSCCRGSILSLFSEWPALTWRLTWRLVVVPRRNRTSVPVPWHERLRGSLALPHIVARPLCGRWGQNTVVSS